MRKSWVQLYAPFLVLMIVQALFVAVAPSRGPSSSANSQLSAGEFNNGSSGSDGSDGSAASGDLSSGGSVTADGSSSGSGGTGSDGSVIGSGSGGGGGIRRHGGVHCALQGRPAVQVGAEQPGPCVPKFSGNNGGATYQGVTAKDDQGRSYSERKPNEQVNAILGAKGLATSAEDDKAAQDDVPRLHQQALRVLRAQDRARRRRR